MVELAFGVITQSLMSRNLSDILMPQCSHINNGHRLLKTVKTSFLSDKQISKHAH